MLLSLLLKKALRIRIQFLIEHFRQMRQDMRRDECLCGPISLIEIERPNDRFHGIGHDILPSPSGILGFPPTHQQKIIHPETLPDFGQHITVDEGGPPRGHLAFRTVIGMKQVLRHDQLQYRIPEKLKSFIV